MKKKKKPKMKIIYFLVSSMVLTVFLKTVSVRHA